jgi:hypothetical protein
MIRSAGIEVKRFSLWSSLLLAGLVLAAVLFPDMTTSTRLAVVYGGLISAGSAIAGFAIVFRCMEGDSLTLVKMYLGGMLARLGFLLGALAVGVSLLNFPAMALAITCLAYYFIFSLLEFFILMPMLTGKGRGKKD